MTEEPARSPAVLVGPALREAKRALRARVVAERDAVLEPVRIRAVQAITDRLAALPSFRDARCVLLTLPFRSEWDTRKLLAIAAARQRTVVLPRVDGTQRMLDLHVVRDIERDTAPGYRGIAEPHAHLPRIGAEAIEWVLVPGVAFDLEGRRLGYGGGFYDRLLAMLPPHAARAAGAFDLQVVPEVPAAPHDLRLDALATESRLWTFPRTG